MRTLHIQNRSTQDEVAALCELAATLLERLQRTECDRAKTQKRFQQMVVAFYGCTPRRPEAIHLSEIKLQNEFDALRG